MPKAATMDMGSLAAFLAWWLRLYSPRARRCSPSSRPTRWPGRWQAWPSPRWPSGWLESTPTRRASQRCSRGKLNINALMSVAVTGAFLIGQWPEAAMVMALYAIAELIEAKAVDRARNAIKGLLELAPEEALVLGPNGAWSTTPVASVAIGATVRIKPGERVPLDGKVTKGNGAINQAPVTGESIPVDKAPGDQVFAGTINETGEPGVRGHGPVEQHHLGQNHSSR